MLEHHDPMLYPWSRPDHAGLMVDGTLHRLEPVNESSPVSWLVDSTGDSLDDYLLSNRHSPMSHRSLVIAVGANASPEVVVEKMVLSHGIATPIIPFIQFEVQNLAVGHAAYSSIHGFIPTAPYHLDGAVTHLWGSYLDDDQLEALDLSEPNYSRLMVSPEVYSATAENGWVTNDFHVYDTYRGILASDGKVIPQSTQGELHEILASTPGLSERFKGSPTDNMMEFSKRFGRPSIDVAFLQAGIVSDTEIVGTSDLDMMDFELD